VPMHEKRPEQRSAIVQVDAVAAPGDGQRCRAPPRCPSMQFKHGLTTHQISTTRKLSARLLSAATNHFMLP